MSAVPGPPLLPQTKAREPIRQQAFRYGDQGVRIARGGQRHKPLDPDRFRGRS